MKSRCTKLAHRVGIKHVFCTFVLYYHEVGHTPNLPKYFQLSYFRKTHRGFLGSPTQNNVNQIGTQKIQTCLRKDRDRHKSLDRDLIARMRFTVPQSHIPDTGCLRQFIAQPPGGSTRLHCTMIRNEDDFVTSSAMYTLYLEHFGGLIPLLKGKRTSKIRPEFIIFDPTASGDVEPRPILTGE